MFIRIFTVNSLTTHNCERHPSRIKRLVTLREFSYRSCHELNVQVSNEQIKNSGMLRHAQISHTYPE